MSIANEFLHNLYCAILWLDGLPKIIQQNRLIDLGLRQGRKRHRDIPLPDVLLMYIGAILGIQIGKDVYKRQHRTVCRMYDEDYGL